MFDIQVIGDAELEAKIMASIPILDKLASVAMQSSLDVVAKEASKYPPESEANFPPEPYYIRGVGTQSSQESNREESEQLGQNWNVSVSRVGKDITGRIFNAVSYAPWVHGDTKQATFHAPRGWRTMSKITEDSKIRVFGIFSGAVRAFTSFFR